MPSQVAQMPQKLGGIYRKGYSKYPNLEQYFDGQSWKFTQGVDFPREVKPANFGSYLRRRCERSGFRCSVLTRGEHVFFQTTGPRALK